VECPYDKPLGQHLNDNTDEKLGKLFSDATNSALRTFAGKTFEHLPWIVGSWNIGLLASVENARAEKKTDQSNPIQ